MTTHVEYESDAYAWLYDTIQGVGRFKRKADDALTYWDTGTDCQDIRDMLALAAHNPRLLAIMFEKLAAESEFHPDHAADLADDDEHPWT